jgi:NAD dependent epimerase/dehydratase family enzyme
MKLLLLGATGLVGSTVLKQALSKDAISQVVAPTRRPLAPQNKLVNPVNAALDALTPRVKSWNIDAMMPRYGLRRYKAMREKSKDDLHTA